MGKCAHFHIKFSFPAKTFRWFYCWGDQVALYWLQEPSLIRKLTGAKPSQFLTNKMLFQGIHATGFFWMIGSLFCLCSFGQNIGLLPLSPRYLGVCSALSIVLPHPSLPCTTPPLCHSSVSGKSWIANNSILWTRLTLPLWNVFPYVTLYSLKYIYTSVIVWYRKTFQYH